MFHEIELDSSFFGQLHRVDEALCAAAQAKGCACCQGRLDRADYSRKPRGGWFGTAGEGETKRFSLCCATEGCRKRVTPPSVRFWGRRVYLSVVVVLASIYATGAVGAGGGTLRAATGVPARTLRRWVLWWQTVFVLGSFYRVAQGNFSSPVEAQELPAGLLSRFVLPTPGERLRAFLLWLSPLTTGSCPNGASLLRAV